MPDDIIKNKNREKQKDLSKYSNFKPEYQKRNINPKDFMTDEPVEVNQELDDDQEYYSIDNENFDLISGNQIIDNNDFVSFPLPKVNNTRRTSVVSAYNGPRTIEENQTLTQTQITDEHLIKNIYKPVLQTVQQNINTHNYRGSQQPFEVVGPAIINNHTLTDSELRERVNNLKSQIPKEEQTSSNIEVLIGHYMLFVKDELICSGKLEDVEYEMSEIILKNNPKFSKLKLNLENDIIVLKRVEILLPRIGE